MIEKVFELLSEGNFKELKKLLNESNESDVAECLDELSKEDLAVVFRLLKKDEAVDIFSYMSSDTQEKLIETLSDQEVATIVSKLYIDDAADLIDELPANLVSKVLQNASPTKRKAINEILKYPEDSAGSIMTVEYVDIKSGLTVKECFDRIRRIGFLARFKRKFGIIHKFQNFFIRHLPVHKCLIAFCCTSFEKMHGIINIIRYSGIHM